MTIDQLRVVWVALNLVTFVLTYSAWVDARADERAVKLLNGAARELATRGLTRSELFRLLVQGCLLIAVIVPAAFVPFMMGVPVLLLISSLLTSRDRRAMTVLVTADVLANRNDMLTRIEEKLDANTEISQGARDDAHEAAEVANHVNEKIKSLDEALLRQGRAIRGDGAVDRIEDLAVETHEKVAEIHDATVEPAGPSAT